MEEVKLASDERTKLLKDANRVVLPIVVAVAVFIAVGLYFFIGALADNFTNRDKGVFLIPIMVLSFLSMSYSVFRLFVLKVTIPPLTMFHALNVYTMFVVLVVLVRYMVF